MSSSTSEQANNLIYNRVQMLVLLTVSSRPRHSGWCANSRASVVRELHGAGVSHRCLSFLDHRYILAYIRMFIKGIWHRTFIQHPEQHHTTYISSQ